MKPIRFGLCTVLMAFAAVANASDWTDWRGPGARGVSPDTGLPSEWSPDPKAEDNNLAWSAPYGSRSTPLVMNGKVYLLNYVADKSEGADVAETIQERVMCLDFETGKKVWERAFNVFHTDIVTVRLGWTNMAADPATGNVYAHGTQGFLLCLDGKTGDTVWQRQLSEEYGRITGYGGRVTSPVIYNDLVIVGMLNSSWGDQGKGGNRFVAFDKKNGKVRWWSEPGGQPKDTYYSVPVIATINGVDLVISGGADGGVYAMKAATGEKVWGYIFGTTAVNCSPVVDGNFVYIGQGEENPDNNEQGRVICLDASKVQDGKPALVWKVDGLKARYTSPIFQGGKLYITDDVGNLYCLDGKTGEEVWTHRYGRNSRGSPVYGEGKIYVGEVNSKFHIIGDHPTKPKKLHSQHFTSDDGVSDVEINGSPAIAHGKVLFSTSEATYCIGTKKAKSVEAKSEAGAPKKSEGPVTHLQVVPADTELHPGGSEQFKVYGYDANGVFVKEVEAEWSLPEPPLPKGAKTGPPALTGTIKDGSLSVDAKKASQQGYVAAKSGKLEGKARVRVAPKYAYEQDFSKVPDGAVPGGWVNTQGKFVVATVKGEKLLRKVNDKASPLIAKGNAYIGLPTDKDYTIEADVQGSKVGKDLPDVGVVANRYTLMLAGNIGKLRLVSWDALPRIDRTITYKFEPDVWYRMKLTIESNGKTATAKGKIWKRGEEEPKDWTVTIDDPRPNTEGAPALYGYVTGIPEGGAGTEIYYDNVRITPSKK